MSDANLFVKKKISRNNIIVEIFDIYDDILDKEIIIKNEMKTELDSQKKIIMEINELELKQCDEYTIDRQEIIKEMTTNITGYKPSDATLKLMESIREQKKDVAYHKTVIQYLETQIPSSGVATNYKVNFSNPNQSCRE